MGRGGEAMAERKRRTSRLWTRGDELAYPYFIIDGKAYDLTDWIAKHPGGARWFSRANGRDSMPISGSNPQT